MIDFNDWFLLSEKGDNQLQITILEVKNCDSRKEYLESINSI